MVRENCRVADQAQPDSFTKEDFDLIEQVKAQIRANERIGCTGCRYCMPCPKGVDIPGIFRCWNAMFIESRTQGRFQFTQTVGLTQRPAFATQCVGCGKCEQHCPQSLPMNGEFPVLKPGANAISWTGTVTKVVVKPNWRYLKAGEK